MFFPTSILILLFSLLYTHITCASHPKDFSEAKKQARILWAEHRTSFYCGCKFDKQLNVDLPSCDYIPQDFQKAKHIEWEHLLPVSWFGKQRPCWKQRLCTKHNGKKYKGRRCCEKIDKQFKKMASDLYNLVPAIGEVNAARSNYRFTEFYPTERTYFQGCAITIDPYYRAVEPADHLKGWIARAHLYMENRYQAKLSKAQQTRFHYWNKTYPPSAWEKEWNQRVGAIQGQDNPFISQYEKS